MKNNAFISLTSIQWQDGEKNESELYTKAYCEIGKDTSIISYEDTSATGFEGSVTTIRVDKNKNVSIMRKGTSNTVLTLELGKKHFCQYGTPFGSVQLGVFTHLLEDNLRNDGSIYLKYTLDVNSSLLSDNEIILKIKNIDANN